MSVTSATRNVMLGETTSSQLGARRPLPARAAGHTISNDDSEPSGYAALDTGREANWGASPLARRAL